MSENPDNGLSPEVLGSLVDAVRHGVPLAEAVGIKKEAIESLYGLGYNLYNAGDNESAETVFQALCLYDFNDYRFWMGLGAARQARDKYLEAVDAYSFAMIASSLREPEPIYYSGICFLKLGDLDAAATSFESLKTMFDMAKADHAALWEKASGFLEIIRQRKEN
ncbi:MAG: SycD/LcrH family type III secretion system chaperone [Deltaproteobacteria bacterium]|jgi:type III secretion system low calcium response chaperone LcrH/SycD|nr:SycD/LcrH family type III secretion system chaperone [Deltaproteobacteria bacterium]